MAKQVTFQVSKPSAGLKFEATWMQPENLEDPRWGEVVSNPAEDINELAVQNLIIKIQGGARNELEEKGEEAAQKYIDEYKFGARSGGGFRRPTVTASQAAQVGFTEEQMALLRAAGVKFATEQEEQAEAEAEAAAVGA